MMRYEDLSTFFGDSKTFEIHCNDKITFIAGQFARIKKEIGSENVLLYKVIDENDVFTSGYLPRQSDVFVLDESIRSYYFCRIEKVVAKVAHISILCFSKDYKSYDNETITKQVSVS